MQQLEKAQMSSPFYFTELSLCAFLFSFLTHSSPMGLCWGDYEDA